jgi:hypothetical protein
MRLPSYYGGRLDYIRSFVLNAGAKIPDVNVDL